jgi:hypothetical protein
MVFDRNGKLHLKHPFNGNLRTWAPDSKSIAVSSMLIGDENQIEIIPVGEQ